MKTAEQYYRDSVAFFWHNAGWSYDPKSESSAQGRMRSAKALADAELQAKNCGLAFGWSIDPYIDSSDFNDEKPAWQLWNCLCRDENGACVASLGGVDFGRDGDPWSSSYRRVVEAELALEVLANKEAA